MSNTISFIEDFVDCINIKEKFNDSEFFFSTYLNIMI
jgi:hypothetical protein